MRGSDNDSIASSACGIHFHLDSADAAIEHASDIRSNDQRDVRADSAASDTAERAALVSNGLATAAAACTDSVGIAACTTRSVAGSARVGVQEEDVAIKLCGLRRIEEIELCNELGVDYIGFIFVTGSKRVVSDSQAKELKKHLAPTIKAVGVFVNESIERIVSLAAQGIIDVIQLHGKENNEYIQRLREALSNYSGAALDNMPIIKALAVSTYDDVALADTYASDYILLDSGPGGTGSTFNWALGGSMNRPYFLAGGLNLQNIESALATCHPMAVDVSSGIETDGVKDLAKMRDFVAKVRAFNQAR